MTKKESKNVRTLKSFIAWVEQFNDGEYVFRGVSNVKYPIEASTYRRLKDKDGNFRKQEYDTPEKLLKINEEMLEDARRQGHGRRDGEPLKDLDLLAELQHRGAATCLIDFTKNPLVALWMACREGARGNANGKVYAVDISSQLTFQPVTSQLSQEKDIDHFFQRDENGEYRLYQWQPNYQKTRMLAQQSIFLFGGTKIEPAAECIVFKNSKQTIRNSLEKSVGITEGILFPDFDGFANQRTQNKAYIEPDPQYYFQRGLDASRERKIDEAIDYYSKGISLKPNNHVLAFFYMGRASVYEFDGKTDQAIEDYSKAVELNPDFDIAYYARGELYHNTNKFDMAIEDYSTSIRLDPDNVKVHFKRGNTKFAIGQYAEAIADFNEAIRLEPNSHIYNNRGNAKSALKQYVEAIADFDEAIRLNPNDSLVYNNRGNAKVRLEQYVEAIADYDEAIHLEPDNAGVYSNRGNAKSALKQYVEAIADFDEAIHLEPNSHIYNNRGNVKFQLERYVEAIADYDEAIRLDANYPVPYHNRGKARAALGLISEADQDFQMALQLAEQTENADLIAEITKQLEELNSHGGES